MLPLHFIKHVLATCTLAASTLLGVDAASDVHTSSIPNAQAPLHVTGFAPSLHVGPAQFDAWPKPVMIFLHGIHADVSEQCGWWQDVGRAHGWMICIRGARQPNTTRQQNRWTHRNWQTTHREIDAALTALETKYPGKVSRRNLVLAGYSRGAILAPRLVIAAPDRYRYLFLAEGGMDQLQRISLTTLRQQGIQGIALAMGSAMRRRRAQDLLPSITRAGIKSVYVDMPGAGHRMANNFSIIGREGLLDLVRRDALPHRAP